ncbi:hypothetical protein J5N97_024402 [Dioscorea zingiberensis]|uniref:HD domain-containing protein n=1 Tax=Dioscorea zingiberensis TaxID=325984 RepID=A0A9D5H8X6_9LILI|nr:hypothetical protein J5N97_024402 [Dioscorea zingiberensis]
MKFRPSSPLTAAAYETPSRRGLPVSRLAPSVSAVVVSLLLAGEAWRFHTSVMLQPPLSQSLSRRRSPPLSLEILHEDVVVLLLTDVVVSSGVPSSSGVDFLSLCHRLKTTKRAGSIRRGVHRPESVADHMYRMGLMALIAPGIPDINLDRCVKMPIVRRVLLM